MVIGFGISIEDWEKQQREAHEENEETKRKFFESVRKVGDRNELPENDILYRFLNEGCKSEEKEEFKKRLEKYEGEMQGYSCVMEAEIARNALSELDSGDFRSSRIKRYENYLEETVLGEGALQKREDFKQGTRYPPEADEICVKEVFKRYPWIHDFGSQHEIRYLILTDGNYTARNFRGYIELPEKDPLVKEIRDLNPRQRFFYRALLNQFSKSEEKTDRNESYAINTTVRALELEEFQFPFFRRYSDLLGLAVKESDN